MSEGIKETLITDPRKNRARIFAPSRVFWDGKLLGITGQHISSLCSVVSIHCLLLFVTENREDSASSSSDQTTAPPPTLRWTDLTLPAAARVDGQPMQEHSPWPVIRIDVITRR